jgi:hypothetical protein
LPPLQGRSGLSGLPREIRRQIFGRINFDYNEFPYRAIVTTEILETAGESKRSGHRRSQCHRSQIIFALRATKSLLEIDVSDFVRRQLPLLDQFRPKY